MSLHEDIVSFARGLDLELKEKKGVYELSGTIAERKAFLTRQKLTYRAKFRVDDGEKTVTFTELLKEASSGLSAGDTSPGFGFKKESYRSGMHGREGTIEEQSNLFGQKYEYRFDYKAVRARLQEMARAAGYAFEYRVTGLGL